jgi:hypothetical protein
MLTGNGGREESGEGIRTLGGGERGDGHQDPIRDGHRDPKGRIGEDDGKWKRASGPWEERGASGPQKKQLQNP